MNQNYNNPNNVPNGNFNQNGNYNQNGNFQNNNFNPNPNYTYKNDPTIPPYYRPLSPWAYFGYNILFAIPLIGLIFLIVYAFDNSNINRKNYARSFFIVWLLVVIIIAVFAAVGFGTAGIISTRSVFY